MLSDDVAHPLDELLEHCTKRIVCSLGIKNTTLLIRAHNMAEKSIHWYAKHGDMFNVSKLIDSGADINTMKKCRSILYYAVGNFEMLSFLLEKGADPNTGKHFKVLQEVTERGGLESVKLLVEYGAEYLYPVKYAIMPILIAARRSHWDIVSYFASLNPIHCGVAGEVVYHVIWFRKIDVLRTILQKTSPSDMSKLPYGKELMAYAVQSNDLGIMSLLYEHGAISTITKRGNTQSSSIISAIERNNIPMFRFILKHEPKMANHALFSLIRLTVCNLSDVKALVKLGAVVGECDKIVKYALNRRQPNNVLAYLIRMGGEVTNEDKYAGGVQRAHLIDVERTKRLKYIQENCFDGGHEEVFSKIWTYLDQEIVE